MKLVELVLGCAVQCEKRQRYGTINVVYHDNEIRYIERLMNDLDKLSQANIMILTQVPLPLPLPAYLTSFLRLQQIMAKGEQSLLDRSESDILDTTGVSDEIDADILLNQTNVEMEGLF